VIDSGRTVAEVARELGLGEPLLGKWVGDERRRIAAAEVHGEKPVTPAEWTTPENLETIRYRKDDLHGYGTQIPRGVEGTSGRDGA